ncbi:MAG: SDR family NAD(P)-dependent oxidoreductase [Candidatus Gottesmanbacteria bacterium]
MNKNILVTGGAGFIGSFLVDKLISQGYRVKILDNLDFQVHQGKVPAYLNKKVNFINGDVTSLKTFKEVLKEVEVVFHLAAKVGVAQSNYKVKDYIDTNIGGMGNLLNALVNSKNCVKKVIMTASMTSYGEGDCHCSSCDRVKPSLRTLDQLKNKKWELICPLCGKIVKPIPTNENSSLTQNSIYSISKGVQEQLLFYIGKTYKIPVVSLRCFNVYGPRQSLSNPYTGVSAIFISRLKNNHQPVIYEDGLQTRDFVSVHDVVDALILAMNKREANYQVFNIGSGEPKTIKQIASVLAKLLKKDIDPKINGEYRLNDIRHCYADISKAKNFLKWQPRISFKEGMTELINWSNNQEANDLFVKASHELIKRKLTNEKD